MLSAEDALTQMPGVREGAERTAGEGRLARRSGVRFAFKERWFRRTRRAHPR